jgi:threonine synthase
MTQTNNRKPAASTAPGTPWCDSDMPRWWPERIAWARKNEPNESSSPATFAASRQHGRVCNERELRTGTLLGRLGRIRILPRPPKTLVDDVVLVTDSALLAGMRLAALTLGLVIEPSAAAGLAAIAEHDLPGSRFATVLTGPIPAQTC